MSIKTLGFILFFGFSFSFFSQIPPGYYDNANGQTGYTLKTTLSTIITNGHVPKTYNNLYTGYQTTDNDTFYDNDGTVLDMYSENPTGPDPYFYTHNNRVCGNYSGENSCYNREHLMPQSIFNSAMPMYSDIHFVVPTDGYVNGVRSNLPFGIVESPNYTSQNGSKRGKNIANIAYTTDVFEPIDEFKGDIARCLLYVATRYQSNVSSWTYTGVLNGTSNQVYTDWFINLLVTWHLQDTVNAREIARNNAAYTYQGNRNPYIDHPEYVTQIWGQPDTLPPLAPNNLISSNVTDSSVRLQWDFASDSNTVQSYALFINGTYYTSISSDTIVLTDLLASTNYAFYVRAVDSSGLLSPTTNTVSITTNGTPVGLEEINHPVSFVFYPNPVTQNGTVVTNTPGRIVLYNLQGQMVRKQNIQAQAKIDFQSLPKGMYVLELQTPAASYRKKIVKE